MMEYEYIILMTQTFSLWILTYVYLFIDPFIFLISRMIISDKINIESVIRVYSNINELKLHGDLDMDKWSHLHKTLES